MNWYFYRIFIPLKLLTFALIAAALFGTVEIYWPIVFASWFLLGPIGIGVGYHRLFSHRQFETWRPVEAAIATLGTLAAYAPLLFWVSNHQFHHKHSDQEQDPSSPGRQGFWESFLWYRLRTRTLDKVDIRNYCARRVLMDSRLRFLSRHFTKIIWVTTLGLAILGPSILLSAYLLPLLIEHLRIDAISSFSHLKVPLSYRNFETPDDSQNNLVVGILGMGFGWHNNHHQDERRLNLRERWWEVDVEGLVATAIRRNPSRSNSETERNQSHLARTSFSSHRRR